jgi:FkbM family methyltransferase
MKVWKNFRRMSFAVTHPKFTLRRLKKGATGASTIELNEIRQYAEEIRLILEAGAANGEDTQRMLSAFPLSHIYAFEPVKRSYLKLIDKFANEPRVNLFNSALSVENGMATIHVSSDKYSDYGEGSSSMLVPTRHVKDFPLISFHESDQELAETVNLDQWAKEVEIDGFDLIWFDLQGMEKLVIESSLRTIRASHLLHIEVSRRPLFEGGCSYREVDRTLKSMGFVKRIERVGLISGNVLYERVH